jgi:uncharacterized damage-inducible protein DinB
LDAKRRSNVSELAADQAYVLVQNALLGTLKSESRTTKSVLAAVPNSNLDYRPDSCAKTAIELVRHIAVSENRFLECVSTGIYDTTSPALPDSITAPADIAAWYEQSFARNFAAVSKLSGEQLIKMVDFRGMFERPAYFFLQLCLVHSVHHRGQLSTYLRPMGSKVPAIYGESYDSAEAKKAAAAQAQA